MSRKSINALLLLLLAIIVITSVPKYTDHADSAQKPNIAVPDMSVSTSATVTKHVSPTIAQTTAQATVATTSTTPYKIIAYYPSWGTYQGQDVSEIKAANITHINYAFANIQNGKVVLGDAWADTQKPFAGDCKDNSCLKGNFNQLIKLKKNNPHLRALISVGGWTWSGQFSDIALTAASRAKFADSAVLFMRKYGFDDIDLDWEYPVSGGLARNKMRAADKTNFTLLLQDIRGKLTAAGNTDGKKYLLTIAAGSFVNYVKNTEIAKVAKIVDWINLMTYDYHGDWEKTSGFNAPLYTDPKDPNKGNAKSNINSTVYTYMNAGVPSNKLVLGIPLYGRSWTGCGPSNQGLYKTCKGVARGVIANGIHEFGHIENKGWNRGGNGFLRYWNNTTKSPWLYNKATDTFVSYEDSESIGYKANYIKAKGLGGAMLWEISQDFHGTLQNKLAQSLK